MPNPYVLLGGLLTVLALCAASFGFGHHVDHLAFVAYQKSETAAAEKQVADNKTALLKQQQDDLAEMARINQTHGEALNEITQRRDALLAANRSLSQRLFVSVASSGSAKPDVPSLGAGGPLDAQARVAALDQRSSEFFIDEFSAADKLAADYAALQQVIIQDRRSCNGSLPGASSLQAGTTLPQQ